MQAIAAKHEVHPNQVGAWKRQAVDGLEDVFAGGRASRDSEHEATHPGPAREDRRVDGGAGFFSARLATLSRAARLELVERDGELSIRRQCALLGINRSSVYYTPREERAENLALMRRMDELSLQYPFYGSRQMARHLGREGVSVGRRRVRRLMRLMGLEALYRKPRTSDAQPGHRIYPYLLRDLTIERPDQVWCADITYIPVAAGFLYLVAVMDWASRHVLAWRLSNTMDTGFCIEALEAALRAGTPEIFNTDQGAQFTSTTFTERVLAAGARCSMDGRGRCLDNVFIDPAVAVAEVRSGVSARVGRWVRGRAGDRGLDDVLQRRTSALGARGSHAGRGLRRGAGSVNMSAACSALDVARPADGPGDAARHPGRRLPARREDAGSGCSTAGLELTSPRRQAALPASRRRYVTVLQGEGSLRRRPPSCTACSASSRGSTSSTTAENTLGTSPPESRSVSDRRRSAARGAREIRSPDPVAVAGYVTAAQCNRNAPDRGANAEKQRRWRARRAAGRSLKYEAVYPYELVDGFRGRAGDRPG